MSDSQLKKDQQLFAKCISELLHFVYTSDWNKKMGFKSVELRLDDFNRPDKRGHMINSRHYERCAGDILLDVDGKYIEDSFHPVYLQMAKFWEGLHPRCRWGGRFRKADGNHFSIASPDLLRA
jgi:hypothetical protein